MTNGRTLDHVLDHVAVVASDLDASRAFYDAALAPLGLTRVMDLATSSGYGGSSGKPVFWVISGDPVTIGVHVAFAAASRDLVEAFYDAALGAGGASRHQPREWPEYHATYYGAFVSDPDGNNIEAVNHG